MANGFTPEGNYRADWNQAEPVFSSSGDALEILGNPVMEKWEDAYMGALAKVATANGGRVLEVGFGLGLSAAHIQSHADVAEHVIIEFNAEIFKKLEQFAKHAADNGRKVTPLHGDWKTVVDTLESDSFDGILYDTYPLSEAERDTHQFGFISRDNAWRILKPGGILTYCNLTSFGNLKQGYSDDHAGNLALFNASQRSSLIQAGFKDENISLESVPVEPDPGCDYYQFSTALVPKAVK